MKIVGTSEKRIDARDKVTGKAQFPGDINLPDHAYMKILFAGRPHAIIQRIDTDAAEAAVRFMSGWTELTRPSYRCGRIIDRVAYDALAAEAGTTGSITFPAYREGDSA